MFCEWGRNIDELREEALVWDNQYWPASRRPYLKRDTVWREDGTAYGTFEAVLVREDPTDESS